MYTTTEIHDMRIIDKVCDDDHALSEISLLIINGDLEKYTTYPFLNIRNEKYLKKNSLEVVNI